MAISTFAPRQSYIGNGAVLSYTFNFKILSLDQLLVVVLDNLNNVVGNYRGTDTSFLASVVYDNDLGGGTVNLLAVLPNGYKIVILEADDAPIQPQRWRDKSQFSLRLIETCLDRVVLSIQRIAYRSSRSVRLNEADETGAFDPTLPPGIGAALNLIPVISATGGGWAPLAQWIPRPSLQAAIDAATNAALSAASASISATSAANSAATCVNSVSTAQAAATQAGNSAASAQSFASNASTSAGTAQGASAAASTYATNSGNSATTAQNAATAATTSAGQASTSATNAANSATTAVTAANNAGNAQSSAQGYANNAQNSANAAAASAAAAAGSSSAPGLIGTYSNPTLISTGAQIPFGQSTYLNIQFIKGNGGSVNLASVNPQISAGTSAGQRMVVIGTDDNNTVRIVDGNGVKLNGGAGELYFFANTTSEFIWSGSTWNQL